MIIFAYVALYVNNYGYYNLREQLVWIATTAKTVIMYVMVVLAMIRVVYAPIPLLMIPTVSSHHSQTVMVIVSVVQISTLVEIVPGGPVEESLTSGKICVVSKTNGENNSGQYK